MRHIDKGIFETWDTEQIREAFIKRTHEVHFAWVGQQQANGLLCLDRTPLVWLGYEYLIGIPA
ncbi:MAG: hypothetical protein E6Q97_24045 [Desulfurellales bacterium]|nr:MAG: hypothetical protein E6Q97_24045 [Desulfurellales bacterium]